MTAIERAQEFLDGFVQASRSLSWPEVRNAAVLSLASIFDALEQSGYERGVADGQALAALNQQTKGD